MKKMRGIVALCVALTMGLGSSALLAQKADPKKEVKRTKAEQVDIDTLVTVVDAVAAGRAAAPSDIAVTWDSNHFFRAPDGSTYMPFTVTVDKSKIASPTAALYIRVVEQGRRRPPPRRRPRATTRTRTPPVHAWEKFDFAMLGPDGKLARYIQVKPGDYDLYRRDQGQGHGREGGQELHAESRHPEEGSDGSRLQHAGPHDEQHAPLDAVFSRPPAGVTADDDPYIFGQMQIVPSRDGKYKKTDTLSVVYWVYGATGDTAGKPDLTGREQLQSEDGGRREVLQQDAAAGVERAEPVQRLDGRAELPGSAAGEFPPGDYRLEIKITDKASGKTVTQNVNFPVAAS